MIELRWVEGARYFIESKSELDRKLQYREGFSYFASSGLDDRGHETFDDIPTWEGTEWIDVPVVQEP